MSSVAIFLARGATHTHKLDGIIFEPGPKTCRQYLKRSAHVRRQDSEEMIEVQKL